MQRKLELSKLETPQQQRTNELFTNLRWERGKFASGPWHWPSFSQAYDGGPPRAFDGLRGSSSPAPHYWLAERIVHHAAPSHAADWLRRLSVMQPCPLPLTSREGRVYTMGKPLSQLAVRNKGDTAISELLPFMLVSSPPPLQAVRPGHSSHEDYWLSLGSQHFISSQDFFFF